MLDDLTYIAKVDKSDVLDFTFKQPKQLLHSFNVASFKFTNQIENVVFSGMGGSALSAELIKSWPGLPVPFIINKSYDLPVWANKGSLVICSSYSGNTEETLAVFKKALQQKTQLVVLAHGGSLLDAARVNDVPYVEIPTCQQPRTSTMYSLRAAIEVLIAAGLLDETVIGELETVAQPLEDACRQWVADQPESNNQAKQIASNMVGKTSIIYGGSLTFPAAYIWKISVNENAKNTAWVGQLPEFNHNEFLGWSLYPVEKPFAVIDLISSFEHERILKRFEVSDRMLSGKRPKSITVAAKGKSILEQLLYLVLLGNYATTYLAILNNVDPAPVNLVEKFKKELG